jgi:hypothetical protein
MSRPLLVIMGASLQYRMAHIRKQATICTGKIALAKVRKAAPQPQPAADALERK